MSETQVSQQKADGSWCVAVPLPFYNGWLWFWRGFFVCECGAKFWRESSYVAHYEIEHDDDLDECGYCGRTGCVGSCQL